MIANQGTGISSMPTVELPAAPAKHYTLTAVERDLLPSEEDVLRYEAQGYYVSKPGVISIPRAAKAGLP